MPQNGILHEGVAALAEAFKSNPNLKVGSTAVSTKLNSLYIYCANCVCHETDIVFCVERIILAQHVNKVCLYS